MSSPKRPSPPVARPAEPSQANRRTTRLNMLPEVESDPELLPSANERWLQFSRWLLYHRAELRATQYVYGTPDDIPSATKEEAQKALQDLALWDTASTPADGLPAFFEEALGLSSEPLSDFELDAAGLPHASHEPLPQDPLDTSQLQGEHQGAPHVADFATHSTAPDEDPGSGLFGRARRRLRRVRDRLRDVRDLL